MLAVLQVQEGKAAVLSSVQTGICSIGAGSLLVSCPIASALTDTTQTFVTFQATTSNNTPGGSNVRCFISSTTTITCDRFDTAGTANIRWHTAEFSSGVSVQHITGPCNVDGDPNEDITDVAVAPVNLAETFLLFSNRQAGTAQDANDFKTVALTSPTSVEIRQAGFGNCATGGSEFALQVVGYSGANVTRGLTAAMTGTSLPVTSLPSVNMASTALIYSYRMANGGNNIADRMVRGRIDSGTSLSFMRGDPNGQIDTIAWERIEFTDGTTVQQRDVSMGAGTGTANVAVTSVDTSRTIAFAGGQSESGQGFGETSFTGDDILGVAVGRHALTSSTNLQVARDDTSGTADWTSYIVEFASGGGGPTIYYVRTDGNDANPGTTNSPAGAWRNIQKAADTMLAGDKTFVVAGTYNELVVPLNGGTAIDPIVYEALGNVVLDGGNTLCYGFRVENNSGYTTIDGFEFTNYLDCGSGHANAYFDNSPNCQVLNNVFHDTGRDAIGFYGTTANCLAHNNLIYNITDDGITPAGSGNHTVRNNTIFNVGVLTGASGWAMESAATAGNVYENNIFWDGIDNTSVATYSYNDYINSVLPGVGNISADPLFINTATGDFHLSQILSGQGSNSPAVDAGGVTAASLGLDIRTTRTDSGADIGTVDQGYHYANGISGPVLDIVKRAFLLDGTPIPTGATIPSGVQFKYLLYINNPSIGRGDVTVRDVLDPAFQYQTATIQVDNSVAECAVTVCTAAEELDIFNAVDAAAFLSDAVDGDVASYTGASSSVDAGDENVANLQLDITANAVWAILFSVKMP